MYGVLTTGLSRKFPHCVFEMLKPHTLNNLIYFTVESKTTPNVKSASLPGIHRYYYIFSHGTTAF